MPRHGTTENFADFLTQGYYHERGETAYYFRPGQPITVDLSGLDARGMQLARWAMDAWSGVADVTFKEVSSGAKLAFVDHGSGANTSARYYNNGEITSATINVSSEWVDKYGAAIDSYSFRTYLHEIGHVLGMGHTGDYNGGADYHRDAEFTNDSWQMSLMSYFAQDENPNIAATRAVNVGPMQADLLAVRSRYGESQNNPTEGRTIWGVGSNLDNYLGDMFREMPVETRDTTVFRNYAFTLYIEDKGGRDKIDFSYDGRAQIIDLRPGSVNDAMGQIDNILIAEGTLIEEYASGNGSDVIRGNGADNRIWSNGGGDKLVGKAGHDRLDGGGGSDQLIGGAGRDKLLGGDSADVLKGGAGADQLLGGLGADRLIGGGGNDVMRGENSPDKLFGGKGHDRMFGHDGVDLLVGAAGNDRLEGGTGGDTLKAGTGDDRLDGGAHGDTLFGGGGRDELFGGEGADVLDGGGLADLLDGGDQGDQLRGGAGYDRLLGGAGADSLFGGAGRDRLDGGTEGDVLTGGRGADRFIFNAGPDTITDFKSGLDKIEIQASQFGMAGMSVEEALEFARETDEGVVFRFDIGCRLMVEDVVRANALADDLIIT